MYDTVKYQQNWKVHPDLMNKEIPGMHLNVNKLSQMGHIITSWVATVSSARD